MYSVLFDNLVNKLKRLPGVGKKSARRMAYHLLLQDNNAALELAASIQDAVRGIKKCSDCGLLTEEDPCAICSDTDREASILCVVESSRDVLLVEQTGTYRGKYYVLDGLLSPLDGVGPLELHLDKFFQHVVDSNIAEVILALSPSTEGETTISYIADKLLVHKICTTRLSTGLPFGSDIEYTSTVTLSNAMTRRYPI